MGVDPNYKLTIIWVEVSTAVQIITKGYTDNNHITLPYWLILRGNGRKHPLGKLHKGVTVGCKNDWP